MRQISLTLITLSIAMVTIAQQVDHAPESFRIPGIIETHEVSHPVSHSKNKQTISDWYSYPRALFIQQRYNAPLFPDSLPVARYGDGQGGVLLANVFYHAAGQVFDPKSEAYDIDQTQLSIYNPYTVDSIWFPFSYRRFNPDTSIVDTVFIQYYNNSGITRTSFTVSQQITSFVNYNRNTNFGTGHVRTDTLFLTHTDTGSLAALQYVNIQVPANGIFATTFSFKPGYSYNPGDTLDADFGSQEPVNLLNAFRFIFFSDESTPPQQQVTYNNGLLITTGIRYNYPDWSNWHGRFIAGNAFTAYRYPDIMFHITSLNVSVDKVPSKSFASINAYPNPVKIGNDVSVAFELISKEKVTIDVSNSLGQKVNSFEEVFSEGKNKFNVSTNGLKKGLYFFTVKAGESAQTFKMNIIE
jgi:hypothetical protein